MKVLRTSLGRVLAILSFTACAEGRDVPGGQEDGVTRSLPTLEVTGAFLFAPITEAQAGGYFTLHNRGEAPDTLVEVSADWADHGMVHETREEAGRVRMSHLAHVAVAAHDSVVLRPGGLHVMLMGLARMPVAGDTVTWVVRMSSGATLPVRAPVVPYGQEP